MHRSTAAIAVDRESLGIAQVASAHALPFIAIRVIVDSAADNLPRAVAAAAEQIGGHLNIWRLLGRAGARAGRAGAADASGRPLPCREPIA